METQGPGRGAETTGRRERGQHRAPGTPTGLKCQELTATSVQDWLEAEALNSRRHRPRRTHRGNPLPPGHGRELGSSLPPQTAGHTSHNPRALQRLRPQAITAPNLGETRSDVESHVPPRTNLPGNQGQAGDPSHWNHRGPQERRLVAAEAPGSEGATSTDLTPQPLPGPPWAQGSCA